jgi:hypothetical protein
MSFIGLFFLTYTVIVRGGRQTAPVPTIAGLGEADVFLTFHFESELIFLEKKC